MFYYCSNCLKLSLYNNCPSCGRKKLHCVKSNDFVYLTTKNDMWSEIITQVLKDNNILYIKKSSSAFNIFLYVCCGGGYFNLYVPFASYEKARKLIEDFFEDE